MKNSICMILAFASLICRVTAQEMAPARVEDRNSDPNQPAQVECGFSTLENLRFRAISRDKFGKVRLRMDRPHIDGDRVYLRAKLHNRSAISYDVDLFRFYVRDLKTSRRTISQEQEMVPVWSYARSQRIESGGKGHFVFVMNKFTLADDKVLRCEIFEKEGGRHFQMRLTNRDINRAVGLHRAGTE